MSQAPTFWWYHKKVFIWYYQTPMLTHWGRVTHICVGKLTIIGSDNGLAPRRRQAIIWTNAGILLIEPLATNFSEILIGIQIFSFAKKRLKMSSAKWRPFCLGLNVLTLLGPMTYIKAPVSGLRTITPEVSRDFPRSLQTFCMMSPGQLYVESLTAEET